MPVKKPTNKKLNEDIAKMTNNVEKEAKSFVDKMLGEVSKTDATKQLVLGAASGWVTGLLAMRMGKVAAISVGGGIILLQCAHKSGYIKVNWDKVNKKMDKVADKVEERISGEGPSWTSKVERFVDRKIDKAETKAKRWWGGEKCQVKEIHIFLASFLAGIALGVATS